MRKAFIILTGLLLTLLFTACKQFTADIDDYLGYWSAETFVTDHSIDSAHRADGASVQCVGSSADAFITLTAQNPKNLTLSKPAGIVEFKALSKQPAAGTDYELKQTGSGTLELTYKQAFLKKYDQGSADLSPTITLKAQDGRVFKHAYTFSIKSNSPPPAPTVVLAKTDESTSHYVLCLKFNPAEMTRTVTAGSVTVPAHKDITSITINDTSYSLLYKDDNSDFKKPAETNPIGSFIGSGEVAQLPPPPPGAWVLYFKTGVRVESSNAQTSYTITLRDKEGVVSDSVTAALKEKFKVTFDAKGGSSVPSQYIEKDGKVAKPSPDPAKTGYVFDDWYTEDTYATKWDFDNNTVTGNITLYANWTAGSNTAYKVEHYQEELNGTYPTTPTAREDKTGTTGQDAAYTPKTYTGFTYQSGLTKINGTVQTSGTINAAGDTVVQLYYKRKTVNLTFNFAGGTVGSSSSDTRSGKYGATFTAPAPIKTGYTLNGWSPALPSSPTFPADDRTYTAQWGLNTYNVTFSVVGGQGTLQGSYGGQSPTAQNGDGTKTLTNVQHSGSVSFTATPATGWEVDSWSTNVTNISADKRTASLTVDGPNKNVTVKFKQKKYNVLFIVPDGQGTLKGSYGGQDLIAQNGSGMIRFTDVPHGSTVSFTTQAANGWEVDKWTLDGSTINGTNTTYTLYPVTGQKTVTVTFKPGVFNLASGSDAWKELKKEAKKEKGSHTILINGEIQATGGDNTGEITLGRNLTIKGGSSAVLNANGITRIFKVENGKTLILKDITLKNAQVGSTNQGGGVYIDNGGTLIMQGSTTITNCKAGKGGGVYVKGTFKMEGSALVNDESGTDNEVYLESGKTVTVTDTLTHEPAAKIRLADYQKNRVLAVGEHAKKENFKLAPDGGNNWRYKKVGDEIKFVTGKLTYTIEKIISIEEHDGTTWAEYYWTMQIDGKTVSRKKPGQSWKPKTPTDKKKPRPEYQINESKTVLFDYTDDKTVGAYFLIKEEDHGTGGDDTVADVTKDIKYENDQLKFEGQTISLDQEKTFRLEFHGSGEGDVDVVCRIKWEDE